ncbi:MAG TPA: Fe-S cluster assembly protein SufD [Candidatus Sulfotelmatobacter sp.]|jgi:Fe-S cluster assembly protein SufD|nr:Fe-S cluster assembly protein SufD [Candidatus Sulfotelmatobacter sp.]
MSAGAPAAQARPFAALLAHALPGEPAWLAALRSRGRARFETLGLPGPGDEDWRQTNVRPLAGIPFALAGAAEASAADLSGPGIASALPVRFVLVNGRFDAGLSTRDGLAAGVSVSDLATALRTAPSEIEPHLGRIAPIDEAPFAALNTATFVDGALVRLGENVVSSEPIHILHLTVGSGAPAAVSSRTLVLAAPGSSAVVVETFAGSGSGPALTNAVTEIVLGAHARIEHVKVQAEPEETWHIGALAGHVARGGCLRSHNVSLGARLARNDIGARLDGEGAECVLYGLYLADGAQHVDNHTWLDHAKPHCPSWEVYKGVLAGRARAVFNGRIVVREGAQKTDAKQSNKNLILSEGATVHTRPQLEIHANDVKCTHGATIGRLDAAALFYLRSRGIGEAAARDLLIHAFADDILAKIPAAAVREALASALYGRLERDLAVRP